MKIKLLKEKISNLLKNISLETKSNGCIIWIQHQDFPKELVLINQWFLEKECSIRYLDFDKSLTSVAIEKQKGLHVKNTLEDKRISYKQFFHDRNINKMYVSPVIFNFNNSNKIKGALNVYRSENRNFSRKEILYINKQANLIQSKYPEIMNSLYFQLCNIIYSQFDSLKSQTCPKESLNQIAHNIESVIGANECSIFLKKPFKNEYELFATTWKKSIKDVYKPCRKEGLTGLVLEEGRILKIPNLKRNKELIESKYKVKWKNSLNLDCEDLSFLAAPVTAGGEILGLIRCSATKSVISDFSEVESQILTSIAQLLGQCWDNWINKKKLCKEEEIMTDFIAETEKINKYFYKIFVENKEIDFYQKIVDIVKKCVQSSAQVSIRYFHNNGEYYSFKKHCSSSLISLDGYFLTDKNLYENVYKKHKIYARNSDQIKNINPWNQKRFSKVKCLVSAPIKISDGGHAVLDVIAEENCYFPKKSVYIVGVLAEHLGSYESIKEKIRNKNSKRKIEGFYIRPCLTTTKGYRYKKLYAIKTSNKKTQKIFLGDLSMTDEEIKNKIKRHLLSQNKRGVINSS